MWHLVRKDFTLVGKQVASYIFLGIVVCGVLAASGTGSTILYTFVMVSLWNFAARISYLEEKNHAYGFLWTLPGNRSELVLSKYVGIALFWVIDVLTFALAAEIFYRVGLASENVFPLQQAFVSSSVFLVMIALYMLLVFKVGYMRASSNIRLVFLLFLLPLVMPAQWSGAVAAPLQLMASNPNIIYVIPAVVAVIYVLCAGISVVMFNRKELISLD